ncbi:hypothetical protein [Microcoleus sp. FACHB-831]|nr:hypothetical protein [Microcoleus sp. FACHB-831]
MPSSLPHFILPERLEVLRGYIARSPFTSDLSQLRSQGAIAS